MRSLNGGKGVQGVKERRDGVARIRQGLGRLGQEVMLVVNEDDMRERQIAPDTQVEIESLADSERRRVVSGFKAKSYNIPRGSVATYYPETNNLMPVSHHDPKSKTPSAKSIPVLVRPSLLCGADTDGQERGGCHCELSEQHELEYLLTPLVSRCRNDPDAHRGIHGGERGVNSRFAPTCGYGGPRLAQQHRAQNRAVGFQPLRTQRWATTGTCEYPATLLMVTRSNPSSTMSYRGQRAAISEMAIRLSIRARAAPRQLCTP